MIWLLLLSVLCSSGTKTGQQLWLQVHRDVERSGPQRRRAPGGHLGAGQAESEEGAWPAEEEEEAEAVRQRAAHHQKPAGHQEEGEVLREPAGTVSRGVGGENAQRVNVVEGGTRVVVVDVLIWSTE